MGMCGQQVNDLESEVYRCLEEAGKIGDKERQHDLGLHSIESKGWHVEQAAKAAEAAGWPAKEIARRLVETIEKHNYNISRRLVYDVCSPLGYSNTRAEEDEKSAESAQENGSYILENADIIDIAQAHEDWWRTFREKCKSQPFESMMTHPEWAEEKYLLRKAAEMASEDIDDRQTVNYDNQHILVWGYGKGSIQLAAQRYVDKVKEMAAISTKQASKILGGMGRKCHIRYSPKNTFEASQNGYVGVQCPQCKEWRVQPHKTKIAILWCFSCENEFPRKLEKLPLLRGAVIDESRAM